MWDSDSNNSVSFTLKCFHTLCYTSSSNRYYSSYIISHGKMLQNQRRAASSSSGWKMTRHKSRRACTDCRKLMHSYDLINQVCQLISSNFSDTSPMTDLSLSLALGFSVIWFLLSASCQSYSVNWGGKNVKFKFSQSANPNRETTQRGMRNWIMLCNREEEEKRRRLWIQFEIRGTSWFKLKLSEIMTRRNLLIEL